jgi:hypothetical protein
MVVPLTPKPTRKTEALVRVPSTITLFHEEDSAVRNWPLSRYCCANCILETKTKVGSTTVKVPDPRTHPNIDEVSTTPKSHTHLKKISLTLGQNFWEQVSSHQWKGRGIDGGVRPRTGTSERISLAHRADTRPDYVWWGNVCSCLLKDVTLGGVRSGILS